MDSLLLDLADDLTVAIGTARVTLTPSQGLEFSEQLARKSFRRALAEEAEAMSPASKANQ
jgi:hypothetical protein